MLAPSMPATTAMARRAARQGTGLRDALRAELRPLVRLAAPVALAEVAWMTIPS
jgi:hypothetical protein